MTTTATPDVPARAGPSAGPDEAALTPRKIVEALDRHIIGQAQAKRAVAIAIRNRWRRQQLPEGLREEVGPKNILMIGPTGVGKTEIARRLAALVNAPFIKVEATKFTEVGYHGRDVDSMVRDLLARAIQMVRDEQLAQVRAQAEAAAEDRLLDALLPPGTVEPAGGGSDLPAGDRLRRHREKFREKLRSGALDDRLVDVGVEEKVVPVGMVAAVGGPEGFDPEMQQFLEKLFPSQTRQRRLPVAKAREILIQQEAEKLVDREQIVEQAIRRCEQTGIIFLDEIDKIAGTDRTHGPDVSRQGVQRDLLPIIEGSTVMTRHGPVRTDHILFIAAGAFHSAKPSDLMPELQGRFPIRVELDDLTREDFVRILTEPENAITRQHIALLATEGIDLSFTPDAIEALAEAAWRLNQQGQNIGARRLHTVTEKVLEEISFSAPDDAPRRVCIDRAYVERQLAPICEDTDLSQFIL